MSNINKTLLLLSVLCFFSCIKEPKVDPCFCSPIPPPHSYDTVITNFENGKIVKEIHIKDNGSGIGNVTLTKNYVYLLDGPVFVNNGQVLKIEPGTIIKGKAGQNASASSLIVARESKIFAEGTKEEPIIFTSEQDNVMRYDDGTFQDGDLLTENDRGLWGGLIILGNGIINEPIEGGESSIEGIPSSGSRGLYGGSDNTDNSGILKYISIRHGGTDIGAGNEINGLTLAGVGSGTEIDYIEVVANKDDGIEFFGGAAHVKHAVVYSNADDSFDWDQGYVGKGQFWLAINPGDRAFECDGDDTPGNAPFTKPTVSNISILGIGGKPMTLRENSGGYISNMLAYNFKQVIDLQDVNIPDALTRFETTDGQLEYIYYSQVDTTNGALAFSYNDDSGFTNQSYNNAIITNSENDPSDWNLSITKLAVNKKGVTPSDVWFTNADYAGAFDPNTENGNWLRGWTYLDNKGMLD